MAGFCCLLQYEEWWIWYERLRHCFFFSNWRIITRVISSNKKILLPAAEGDRHRRRRLFGFYHHCVDKQQWEKIACFSHMNIPTSQSLEPSTQCKNVQEQKSHITTCTTAKTTYNKRVESELAQRVITLALFSSSFPVLVWIWWKAFGVTNDSDKFWTLKKLIKTVTQYNSSKTCNLASRSFKCCLW